MEYCKFQIGCLVVLLYVAFVYLRDSRKYHLNLRETYFDELVMLGIISVFLTE